MNTTDHAQTGAPVAAAAACPRRMLVPLDLTANSRKALPYAARVAEEGSTAVWLLHVVNLGVFAPDVMDLPLCHTVAHDIRRAERYLRMLAHRELPAGVAVQALVETGQTARKVVEVAERIRAELIILTAPRKHWLNRLLGGDPARWIEDHAPCSVVVLREPEYLKSDELPSRRVAPAPMPA